MHRIDWLTFDYKVTKAKIEKECNDTAKEYGDYHSGLNSGIKFRDLELNSYEEAVDYINENGRGWYENMAVSYKSGAHTKKSKELTEKLKELEIKEKEYEKAHSSSSFKAEFVGCSCCGSKLSKKHLVGNTCPLCNNDLRSKTTLDTLKRYNERKLELIEQIKSERNKKAKVMWLVKIEYHV